MLGKWLPIFKTTPADPSKRKDGHLRYRPDIDGLRALAVISVILFHAGAPWFSGGFIGVDVFFVISGFLITSLLIGELSVGDFSILRFYERRARRIMPALSLILLFCLAASFALMIPDQMIDFGKSLVSVCFFASNIFYWKSSGYFAAAAEEKPLLHTWSLGVEEQYYILFPLFIGLFWKKGYRKGLFLMIVAGALLSLGLSEVAARYKPMANFYLLPSRAWELLIGSLLAFLSHKTPLHERLSVQSNQYLSAMGFALILGPIFLYDKQTPFPGLFALAPTLGAALCIGFGHPRTITTRLLSTRVLVGIGLISYSAYLWHHPLFAFARIATLNNVAPHIYAGLIAATFVLAFISWRYVERPFRKKTFISRNSIFLLTGLFSLFFIMAGGSLVMSQDKDTASEYARRINIGLNQSCDVSAATFQPSSECATAPEPDTLLWGDSIAMHLVAGLTTAPSSVKLLQATKSVCGPLLGVAPLSHDGKYKESWAKDCLSFNDSVLRYIAQTDSIKTVILSSTFAAYVDDTLFDLLSSEGIRHPSVHDAIKSMKETIAAIRTYGKKVVVFAPPPSTKINIGDCLQRKKLNKPMWGISPSCSIDRSAYQNQKKGVLDFLSRLEKEADVTVIRFDPLLCDDQRCLTSWEGTALYRDSIHLSYDGSALLGHLMGFNRLIEQYAR